MSVRPLAIQITSKRCLRSLQARCITTQTSSAEPPTSGAAKLSNRSLISLHGPDAPKFLQGIITNNVGIDSATSSGFFAAFLTAQGKVLNDVFIYPTMRSKWQNEQFSDNDTGYLVEVDAEQADLLHKHLKRHKLRSKFKLRRLDAGELDVWSVWKEDERWTAHTKATADGEIIQSKDCRAPGMGHRILLSSATTLANTPGMEGLQEAPLSAYTIRRYIKGVVEGQKEIPREESLPMNYNIDLMGGIDFKKGCYIGQELTIRTHHTGVVRRRVLPVILYQETDAPPSAQSYNPAFTAHIPEDQLGIKKAGTMKRATGKLIANIGNVGLAMCRLEQMSDLKVSSEGNSYNAGDKFVIQTDDTSTIGIEALIPDWIRSRIREPRTQKRVE